MLFPGINKTVRDQHNREGGTAVFASTGEHVTTAPEIEGLAFLSHPAWFDRVRGRTLGKRAVGTFLQRLMDNHACRALRRPSAIVITGYDDASDESWIAVLAVTRPAVAARLPERSLYQEITLADAE